MKTAGILMIMVVVCGFTPVKASQDSTAKAAFYTAQQALVEMLEGNKPLSYEKAIYHIENAWYGGGISEATFTRMLDFHTENVRQLIATRYEKQNFTTTLRATAAQQQERYEKALANWAIYTYLTDTILFVSPEGLMLHLPYTYSYRDPLATADWTNTQVINLLLKGQGNCFAMVSLFRILSERLGSDAFISTVPGHIYIRHADKNGIVHNVEPSTRSFPGTGTLQVLTYSSDEAVRSGISMRNLDTRQSVALCLVYLAKGFEYKFGIRTDDFLLECADIALQHDSLNLNALLLKAGILEERLLVRGSSVEDLQRYTDFNEYESLIRELHRLHYREMPLEMKNLIMAMHKKERFPGIVEDKTPQPSKHLGITQDRYVTLSGGLFEEFDYDKPVEQYGRTLFDSETKKISGFLTETPQLYNYYQFDPVVFAWSIDPLAAKYPYMSPYAAFAGNPIYYRDPDGADVEGFMALLKASIYGSAIQTLSDASETFNATINHFVSVNGGENPNSAKTDGKWSNVNISFGTFNETPGSDGNELLGRNIFQIKINGKWQDITSVDDNVLDGLESSSGNLRILIEFNTATGSDYFKNIVVGAHEVGLHLIALGQLANDVLAGAKSLRNVKDEIYAGGDESKQMATKHHIGVANGSPVATVYNQILNEVENHLRANRRTLNAKGESYANIKLLGNQMDNDPGEEFQNSKGNYTARQGVRVARMASQNHYRSETGKFKQIQEK